MQGKYAVGELPFYGMIIKTQLTYIYPKFLASHMVMHSWFLLSAMLLPDPSIIRHLLFYRKSLHHILPRESFHQSSRGSIKCLYPRTERIFLFLYLTQPAMLISLGPPSSNHKPVFQSKQKHVGTSGDVNNQLGESDFYVQMIAFDEVQLV